MKKLILRNERFFIAGSKGMVGQAIIKALRKSGYGEKEHGGIFRLRPKNTERWKLGLLACTLSRLLKMPEQVVWEMLPWFRKKAIAVGPKGTWKLDKV